MKTCTTCGVSKPLSEFHRLSKSADGHSFSCKQCMNARQRAYRKSAAFNSEEAKAKRSDYYYANKDHIRKLDAERHAAAPHVRRNQVLRKKFGIGVDEYDVMLNAQGGVCAICKLPERAINTSTGAVASMPVDHDHRTGKIRGLLCSHCNRAVGLFQDNPQILKSAINYLERAAQ